MTSDPREMVRDGYDAAAAAYAAWLSESVVDPGRGLFEERFCAMLPQGASVLELGCGGGGSTTARLVERFELTGIDLSATQIALARERLPRGHFIHADMTRYEAPAWSFHGMAAFHSLIHLPQGELPEFLHRAAGWLRPEGLLVASMGARGAGEHYAAQWLAGMPMYWSGYDVDDCLRFIEEAGLSLVDAETVAAFEDGEEAPFLWVLARKRA